MIHAEMATVQMALSIVVCIPDCLVVLLLCLLSGLSALLDTSGATTFKISPSPNVRARDDASDSAGTMAIAMIMVSEEASM